MNPSKKSINAASKRSVKDISRKYCEANIIQHDKSVHECKKKEEIFKYTYLKEYKRYIHILYTLACQL